MRRAPGPLGCLLGALGAAVFLVLAVVLLIAGGLFFLLGGRRIAAALFRRAMNRRFSAQQQSWPQPQNDPEVIDVEAEEILDARDQE
jgi:Flp pilus assembly protein TadB